MQEKKNEQFILPFPCVHKNEVFFDLVKVLMKIRLFVKKIKQQIMLQPHANKLEYA